MAITDVNAYYSPLTNRYGSSEMRQVFSDNNRYGTWRLLWYVLACAERRLGLDITPEQTQEMYDHIDDIDYHAVAEYEKQTKHDVMAHLKEYCDKCPTAAPIIHLGATSCYITDNADIILMRKGLDIVKRKMKNLIDKLCDFCDKHKYVPTMAYTHLQPAQPTTVGKRGCMWLQDIVMDYDILNNINLRLLGCNGATGTQASFVELLGDKTSELNRIIADLLCGDETAYMTISGQTYTRKIDSVVLDALSNVAQSLHKMCNDIRLLQGMHELSEPFGNKQVGSSAMAYKQNPIKCENVCSLSRHIISNTMTAKMNVCTQWLERSLDDSANRRIIIPEVFILVDHILGESIKIVDGLTINGEIRKKHIRDNAPFILMENIIMNATKMGISRQEAHSRIRDLSVIAIENMKSGGDNNLLELIKSDEILGDVHVDADIYKMIGMSIKQVESYLKTIKEDYK